MIEFEGLSPKKYKVILADPPMVGTAGAIKSTSFKPPKPWYKQAFKRGTPMALQHAQADGKAQQLAVELGLTIQAYTQIAPMTPEEVIAVLAFVAGIGIANAPGPHSKREIKEMAVANIDHGIQHGKAQQSSLILPPGMMQ